jgi:hypothetical protein
MNRRPARQDKYFMTIREEGLGERGPKEAGPAGNQHFYGNSFAIRGWLLRIQ